MRASINHFESNIIPYHTHCKWSNVNLAVCVCACVRVFVHARAASDSHRLFLKLSDKVSNYFICYVMNKYELCLTFSIIIISPAPD